MCAFILQVPKGELACLMTLLVKIKVLWKIKKMHMRSFLWCVASLVEGTTNAPTCFCLHYNVNFWRRVPVSQVTFVSLFVYLWHHVLHELLPSETRFHRHHQGHVNLVRPRCQLLDCGAWLNGHSYLQDEDGENSRDTVINQAEWHSGSL